MNTIYITLNNISIKYERQTKLIQLKNLILKFLLLKIFIFVILLFLFFCYHPTKTFHGGNIFFVVVQGVLYFVEVVVDSVEGLYSWEEREKIKKNKKKKKRKKKQ